MYVPFCLFCLSSPFVSFVYEEAIKLIRKVGKLMSAQKQSGEFADDLAELRVRFKPKRNFIKLLDGVGRGLLSG